MPKHVWCILKLYYKGCGGILLSYDVYINIFYNLNWKIFCASSNMSYTNTYYFFIIFDLIQGIRPHLSKLVKNTDFHCTKALIYYVVFLGQNIKHYKLQYIRNLPDARSLVPSTEAICGRSSLMTSSACSLYTECTVEMQVNLSWPRSKLSGRTINDSWLTDATCKIFWHNKGHNKGNRNQSK